MSELAGLTALVTGGAQGIGRGIADELKRRGARLALVDRDAAAMGQALTELGADTLIREVDAADAEALDQAIRGIAGESGGIDILVNNVGLVRDGRVSDMSVADWDLVLEVNLRAAFVCCRAVVPGFKERGRGRIVNIGSRAWLGNVGQVNYSASKGGLVSLTRTLALELARDGITVNCVAPGLIQTPLIDRLPEKVQRRLLEAQPGGKAGSPADVANAVAFFAAPASSFITGQVLHVCGGKSVRSDW